VSAAAPQPSAPTFTPGQLWSYVVNSNDGGGPINIWAGPQGSGNHIIELKSGDAVLVLDVVYKNTLVPLHDVSNVSIEVIVRGRRGWIWFARDNILSRRFRLLSDAP